MGCIFRVVGIAMLAACLGTACSVRAIAASDTLFDWTRVAEGQKSDDSSGDDKDELQSDRPGFGDCPSTVGCGRCQLEMGYDYTYDHDNVASHISHEYPQSLLRIGMFENWFEARVSWSQLQDTDRVFGGARTTVVGSEDMDVGFKIALTPQQGWLPKTGLVVESRLPTGSSSFTSGKMLPAIEYIYEWQVTKNLQVDGLTFLARDADDVTNESFLSTSEAFGAEEKLTESLTAYMQWHETSPSGANTVRTQQVIEGGLIVLLTPNMQYDAEYGVGLNDASPDYFVGTGLVIRR
jgi:hypothetical protein